MLEFLALLFAFPVGVAIGFLIVAFLEAVGV